MKVSIFSSFFFMHLVDNYKRSRKATRSKSNWENSEFETEECMGCFSVIFTIMETQSVGFPINETDLDISAALVSAFSLLWCGGLKNPYPVTEIMWEAYISGDFNIGGRHLSRLFTMTNKILKENEKQKLGYAPKSK